MRRQGERERCGGARALGDNDASWRQSKADDPAKEEERLKDVEREFFDIISSSEDKAQE